MKTSNRVMTLCGSAAAMCALACSGPSAPTPAPAEPPAPVAAPVAEPAAAARPSPEAPQVKRAAPTPKPTPDPKMSPAERAAYHTALRDGRTAHRAKDYPAAIKAFDGALALFADDPRALNERGWARYASGDLAGAEADTRRALGRTVDAQLVGASWYNLGRIFEDRTEPEQAKQAYRRSLAARPNKTVRARLARLDPDAASPLDATRLAGPFADDAALCAHLQAVSGGDSNSCVPLWSPPVADAPFGARFARTHESFYEDDTPGPDTPGSEIWHLVLDVPVGRFVLPRLVSSYNPGAFGMFTEVSIDGPTRRTLADGRTLLWVEATRDYRDSDMGLNEIELSTERTVHVCGLGGSGVPACVGPLTAKVSASRELLHDEDEEPGMQHDLWKRQAEFAIALLDSGVLEVKTVGTPSKGIDRGHVGVHRLAFP